MAADRQEALDLLEDITPISEAASTLRRELSEIHGFSLEAAELMAMEFWRNHCEQCIQTRNRDSWTTVKEFAAGVYGKGLVGNYPHDAAEKAWVEINHWKDEGSDAYLLERDVTAWRNT